MIHEPPSHTSEIYLQPGEFWFGGPHSRVSTILGSCVAITLWHPQLHIGGMCHYMLPSRGHAKAAQPDGRYADEAIALLLREIHLAGCQAREFQAKLFGGGRMFHAAYCEGHGCATLSVCERNIAAGRALVAAHRIALQAEHLGGQGHRQVKFDLWSGHAWLKHTPLPAASRCRPPEVTA